MVDINTATWSQTDSSNTTGTPSFPEAMSPSLVDDNARAIIGAVKRWYVRQGPTLTSTGSANTHVLTYSVAPTALVSGDVYAFVPGATNTGSTTVNVNSLGAISVYAYGSALTGGEIKVGVVAFIAYDGTHFQLTNPCPATRIKLLANKIWYVDGTGGSDGTGNGTSGTPWQTLQFAADWIIANVDASGYSVTINQQGTDSGGLTVNHGIVGATYLNLVLNGTISTANAAAITVFREGSLNLTGNGTLSGSVYGCVCQNGGYLQISGVRFAAVSNSHVYSQIGGVIIIAGNYTIAGNAAHHWAADSNGSISVYPSATITLSGTPAFSTNFVTSSTDGDISADHTITTFSGSATGVRYFASTGGGIYTNAGGSTFFPGSSSGTTDAATFGWYQ